MDVIITAGGIPQPDEPLYEYTKGGNKSLLEISGKPIIQWVLDALSDCSNIDNIVVVGLTEENNLKCKQRLYYCPNHGDLLTNILSAVTMMQQINPSLEMILLVSGDLPAITPPMLEWMINEIREKQHDFYYTVVEDVTMEKSFPESRRTYLPLKDRRVCGGDVLAVRVTDSLMQNSIWKKLIDTRKNPLKQAALFGADTLFLIASKMLSVEQIETRISKKLGIKGKVLITPYAEMGMDVDRPHQLEMMRSFLSKRSLE